MTPAPLIAALILVAIDKALEPTLEDQKREDEAYSARKHSRDTGDAAGDVVDGVYTDGDGTKYVKVFTDVDGVDVFRVEGRSGGLLYQSLSRVPGTRAALWGTPVPDSVRAQNPSQINSDDVMRSSDMTLYRPNGIMYGNVKDGVFYAVAKARVAR